MDERQFTTLANALTSIPSRRHVLTGLAGIGITLGGSWLPECVDAKKRKKKKKKRKKKQPTPTLTPTPQPPPPATPNAFGCLSVDVPCASAAECCSNICEGGVCKAHGAGTCIQESGGACSAGDPVAVGCNNGATCLCLQTTAGSNFCADFLSVPLLDNCAGCAKDADCEALGFPPGSACVPTSEGVCSGVCATGTACLAPCPTSSEA